jgi:hypothetical protein
MSNQVSIVRVEEARMGAADLMINMENFHEEMLKYCPSHDNRHKIYLELRMSVTKFTSRFNYIACLDLIVFVCILVVANRPDGLAITVSALILGIGVLIYRCVVGVKSYLAKPAAKPKFDQRVRPGAAAAAPVVAKPKDKSWLRDSE